MGLLITNYTFLFSVSSMLSLFGYMLVLTQSKILTIQAMMKILGLIIGGVSRIRFGTILKMELDATLTVNILGQRKMGQGEFFMF